MSDGLRLSLLRLVTGRPTQPPRAVRNWPDLTRRFATRDNVGTCAVRCRHYVASTTPALVADGHDVDILAF
jgi:hypothetical protein